MTGIFEDDIQSLRRERELAVLAAQMVGLATGVPCPDILDSRRSGTPACRARYLAMYLSHVAYGWSLHRVAVAFRRDRSTVGIASRWTEEARDRPEIDALLERLEVVLRRAADGPELELKP